MKKACPICENGNNQFERILNEIELLKCKNCHFIYADVPDKEIEEYNSHYDDNIALEYEKGQTRLDEIWFQKIADKFTKRLGKGKVLDVGCGNGILLKFFKQNGWDCYGVDLSPWSINFARKYDFTLVQEKIEETLVLKENNFDLIVSTSTLEHIAQPLLHVEKIFELLKPGGIAYFAGIPNYSSISIKFGFSRFHSNMPPAHVNYFTSKTIRKLFECNSAIDKKIIVKTYGIPEIHELYNVISTTFYSKKVSTSQGITQTTSKNFLSSFIMKFIVSVYYFSGRIFSLGDKLEVTIVKKFGKETS